jgi:hypothetical protein
MAHSPAALRGYLGLRDALSNYVNHVARPPLDFPRVSTTVGGAAA